MYIGFRGREKGFSGWKFGAGEAGAQDVEVTGNWFGTEMCTFGTVTYWSSPKVLLSSLCGRSGWKFVSKEIIIYLLLLHGCNHLGFLRS